MIIKVKSPNVVLKTKDKYLTEDIKIEVDKSVINGEVNTLKNILDATKSARYLFYGYEGESVDHLIGYNDTENVENMSYIFGEADNITKLPEIITSKAKIMSFFANNCSKLECIPFYDTPNVTNLEHAFYGCSCLIDVTNFSKWNTARVTNMSCLFGSSYPIGELKEINMPDMSKVSNPNGLFGNQIGLHTINNVNLISVQRANNNEPFSNNKALTNLTIYNNKWNLQIGSGTTWGHLLTLESLLHTCKECIDTGSSATLTVGSANLEKLANVYVKLTGEAEEDETLPKLPMVQCESTDEGAILVADYMLLKGWNLA